MTSTRTSLAIGLLAIGGLVLAGCESRQDIRGYRFDEERLARVKVGQSSQDEVQNILGSPSSVSTFADRNNTWYYISANTETFAFFKEEVTAQKVVAIEFDENGRVKQVHQYGLQDGREITPNARETPTRGKELGFFEQFFGNIGRFNKPRPPGT